MGRPVPRQFMRNELRYLTAIVPATAYHRRSYAERYSGYIHDAIIVATALVYRDMLSCIASCVFSGVIETRWPTP
jgi:hypothetical protein